jgi:protein phosphatase
MSAAEVPTPLAGLNEAGFRFSTGAASDVGRVRAENEDSLVVRPDLGVWAVADGMGGYEAGRFASTTVTALIDTVGPAASASDLLARFEERILRANDTLRRFGDENGIGTFGTTVVALLVAERHFGCLWCGDSRAYLVRGGAIRQVSRDHTEVQELLDSGRITPQEAASWSRSVITRAIGVVDLPMVDLEQGPVEDGDIFVLCSDGLTGLVGDDEILDAVRSHPPQEACDRLVAATLERGAPDNVTVVVVACRDASAAAAAGSAGATENG